MARFDVWITRFEPQDASPAERLEKAFGIDPGSARSLEQSVPKIVKHALPAKAAGEMRVALEAIGAVVECRPSREVKPVGGSTGRDSAAVFHPPGADLFPAGRVSAIDPFSSAGEPGAPRISVDHVVPAKAEAERVAPSEVDLPEALGESSGPPALAEHPQTGVRRAALTLGAGVAILAIGYLLGSSVFRGDADWMGIAFDGLGIYFLGSGGYDLFTRYRS
jgi:hypothetical protein